MTDKPDLSELPVYCDFFNQAELYERYLIHLIGVVNGGSDDGDNDFTGIDDRRVGLTGLRRDVVDPYVIVETVGDGGDDDTGSTDYFPIGKHTFATMKNCSTPIWDTKCIIIGKKESTTGLRFQMYDKNRRGNDTLLMDIEIPREELPTASTTMEGNDWTTYIKAPSEGECSEIDDDVNLKFKVIVTECTAKIVSEEVTNEMLTSSDSDEGYEYTEVELEADEDDDEFVVGEEDDNALLQCWKRRGRDEDDNSPKKAVLWILGRNDCFMHPHVTKRLFFDQESFDYDLFVLNYKMNGACRSKGWVQDAHYNAHNKYGNFDVYNKDIEKAINIIQGRNNADDEELRKQYKTVLGYAHSTGGPVLLNYLMGCTNGDDNFDGYILNSPFLDWGYVGGDMIEFALERLNWLSKLGILELDTKIACATTPKAIENCPIHYLQEDIVLDDWTAKLWSNYYFPWSMRPLYKVPMTVGFANGVTKVHEKLEQLHKDKKIITTKPFLVITSRGDDILKAEETLSKADYIGPNRYEIELNHNSHDVFLSHDIDDTNMAIDMVALWMKYMKF